MNAYFPPTYTDCILDLSHNNSIPDPLAAFATAAHDADDPITLIIHKATQGGGMVDVTYAPRHAAAKSAGLLWGAYHFCDGSDTVAQADHFLSVVGDPTGVLLALDVERNASQATLGDAVFIASRIAHRIGRWPVIYTGRYGPLGNGSGLPNAILGRCPLWLPEYGNNPVCPDGWTEWAMWQHTDGHMGVDIADAPGIGPCDRSYFAGTADELKQWHADQTK